MKKKVVALLACVFLLFIHVNGALAKQVRVKGYYRSNGTYVQPSYRTAPDRNPYNNWSTKGNVNPYTGQPGYKNPGLGNGLKGFQPITPFCRQQRQTNPYLR